MDKVHVMEVFTRVVEANSFSRAAELMGMSRTSTTIAVQRLEASLQVRLLHRTTRSLRLTQEGAEYYDRAKGVLAEIAEMEEAFSISNRGPKGRLRVEIAAIVGRAVITPQLHLFRRLYPEIELAVEYGDGDVAADLVHKRTDCAIRIGEQRSSTLIARSLGGLDIVTVATPDYLRVFGTPNSLSDLARHIAIRYVPGAGQPADSSFMAGPLGIGQRPKESVVFNDAEACLSYGLNDTGIFQAPRFLADELLRAGSLIEVLPKFGRQALPISLVYPQNQYMPAKLRVFLEWLTEVFSSSVMASPSSVPSQDPKHTVWK